MALRQRGKHNFWHVYYRTVVARPDGSLTYATKTVNLGTADLIEARALEAEYMAKNRAALACREEASPAATPKVSGKD